MVMVRQAGYWGSHFPSVSLIDSLPSASSCSSITAVKALVLLPICHSASGETGPPPPYRVVPAAMVMAGWFPRKVTVSATAEMCSACRRVARYRLRSLRSEASSTALLALGGAPAALPLVQAVSTATARQQQRPPAPRRHRGWPRRKMV